MNKHLPPRTTCWRPRLLAILALAFCLGSCRKEPLDLAQPGARQPATELPVQTNPFSVRNVAKAAATLANRPGKAARPAASRGTGASQQFIYFKFNPQEVDQEQFLALEHDSTVHLMEIPFANMAIYGDDFALNTEKAEELKDGSVYGVTALGNTKPLELLAFRAATDLQRLDTLVQVAESDTALQFQAFREAGVKEQQLARWRFCFFQRPHGTVRYWDQDQNRWEPVRGMQVWSLFLGIPIYTYSNGNGDYTVPWRYSIGTIMGTKAKNPRVNVKPFDTHGTWARTVYTLIAQFIVGSVHIEGWVTPCQMKDGKDFYFGGHTQVRYWSQILNAYYFHDEYCQNEGISKAPWSMVCYAQWANTNGRVDYLGNPRFGDASAPMLGHIPSSGTSLIGQYFLGVLNGTSITNYPNLFNVVTGLLPDMTISVPQAAEPTHYNARLAQTVMHELSHASHYQRVGNTWWLNFITATVKVSPVPGNPYGDPTGYIDVAESWAQFLGTNYALRRYPGSQGVMAATTSGSPNAAYSFQVGYYYRMEELLENEYWFFGGRWIPYGLYHDLMDNTNAPPNNSNEQWDRIQGVSIQQLYNAHGRQMTEMYIYRCNFISQNPSLNQVDIDDIFDAHLVRVCD